ncbi:MAG TPA: hypothetical protein VNJ53_05685 [Gaiellaceae bacterium]|nr:hypothetical protein [Gaiellaceae bacterium]
MVLLAFLGGLAAVLAALAVLVVRGVRLWRQARGTGGRIVAELETFAARAERIERLLADADRAAQELDAALARLRASQARLQVLRKALERSGQRVRWLRALVPR